MLPPLQRIVEGPALVTDPDHFPHQLAAWGNPSFLSTPGHLVSPEAPSGSVSGMAVPEERHSFGTSAGPPPGEPWPAAPAVSSAPHGPTAQRSPIDVGPPAAPPSPAPPRRAPHSGPAPGPSLDLLSAVSVGLPPPVA